MQSKTIPSHLLSEMRVFGLLPVLSSKASRIVSEAENKKSITTTDITSLLRPQYQNGHLFTSTMLVLKKLFDKNNISMSYAPTETKLTGLKTKIQFLYIPEKQVNVVKKEIAVTPKATAKLKRKKTAKEENVPDVIFTALNAYSRILYKNEHFPKSVTYELVNKAKSGDIEARNTIVIHNQKLIASIAVKFHSETLDMMDFIQEGNLGLMKAISMFDTSLGYAFSTYTTYWIMQYMHRALKNFDKIVRVPVHVQDTSKSLQKKIRLIANEFQESDLIDSGEYQKLVKELNLINGAVTNDRISLEADPANEHESSKDGLGMLLTDRTALNPDDQLEMREELVKNATNFGMLIQLVRDLPISGRDKKFFFDYYGLQKNRIGLTLEKVAISSGLTRERVRQLIMKIWGKLKDTECIITFETIDKDLVHLEALETICRQPINLESYIPLIKKSAHDSLKIIAKPKRERPKVMILTNDGSLTVIQAVKKIAEYYNIDSLQLYQQTDEPLIKKVQGVAFYLLLKKFNLDFYDIGLKFGLDSEVVEKICDKVEDELSHKEFEKLKTIF